ncbi:Clr5 domain-containing protein [Xylaria digitata]|nr:Clr5 domain-containing protein [Xylaria digitata]
MQNASDIGSELGKSLTRRGLAFTMHSCAERRSIPVQVAIRKIVHAKQYSHDEWEAMKPTIRKLYIEQRQPLRSVMHIMAHTHSFHATNKMYKSRFNHWGWRKNRNKDQQHAIVYSRQNIGGKMAIQHQIQQLRPPEFFESQEVLLSISKNYTINPLGSQSWNCISLKMSEPVPSTPQYISMVRCCQAETAFLNTVHLLQGGQVHAAFRALNRLFDIMTGSELYKHPQLLTGFWRLCDGMYNICNSINDSSFRLLHEMLYFQGQNAAASFRMSASPGAHLMISVIRLISRIGRDDPNVMRQMFHNAYYAVAESLENNLGENHPIVLIIWTDYYWYFDLPIDPVKDIVARHKTALREAEAASGREADITISLLHNMVFFLFYCAGDYAQARKRLTALMKRTNRRVAAQAPPIGYTFHLQRSHAFGSLLQGLFILQDHGDLGQCEMVIGAAIDWMRRCEGTDAFIHAQMLERDLFILTKAWMEGKNLRNLSLAFANPRLASDSEKKRQREG